MRQHIQPEEYLNQHYAADFKLFGGGMMCGFTLTDSMAPPKRSQFRGLAEFVVCQFELNLLSQSIYTHSQTAYPAWRNYSFPFADTRKCFLGHGMGNHMPYSILRFAQEPRAAPDTLPLALDWKILQDYTAFFLGPYLLCFRTPEHNAEFSRHEFMEKLSHDSDCLACVLTPTGWETRHVCQLTQIPLCDLAECTGGIDTAIGLSKPSPS